MSANTSDPSAVKVTVDNDASGSGHPFRTKVVYGNVCIGGGGGLTLGFWSNKNGLGLINNASDMCFLNTLNLRNGSGANFDPEAGCAAPTAAQLSAGQTAFRSWILGASATNMAYMLSAQLAAMELNVRKAFVGGSTLVYAGKAPANCSVPGRNSLGFISVQSLMDAANAASNHSLATDSVTTLAGDARTCQEFMKTTLDKANNNLNFVQADPSTCNTSCIAAQ